MKRFVEVGTVVLSVVLLGAGGAYAQAKAEKEPAGQPAIPSVPAGKKATERNVTLDQVPEPVKATILKEAKGNKIAELEEMSVDGKVILYEAEWVANGKEVEILVAPDGKIIPVRKGPPSKYFIGLNVVPPSDELRKKLNLPEGQGLVVGAVVPESPAAKAGLKPEDVLLKAGETPLKGMLELIGAVEKSGGKDLVFEVNRAGKTEKITVRPAPRPQGTVIPVEGSKKPEPKK